MTDLQRNNRRSQGGFTLAEIMVTTAIFAIIMIAALAVYDKSNRVFKSSTEAADMQQSTRIAFDKLTSDLRMAGFDYNRGGTPGSNVNPAWTASTLYPAGAKVDVGNGFVYTCTKAGTSGSSAPVWNTTLNGSTTDGSCQWRTDSNGSQYAQPDEQLEYVGQNAIAFRANFDYYSDAKNGNGLEPTYTPKDSSTGLNIFPYVTTGDDEIVVYALRSNDNSKNTQSISFWVDTAGVDQPRTAYPPNGKEVQIKVTGIDTTNDNPPYSLVRMTVADAAGGIIDASKATPVAENLRSLQFYYYTDTAGTKILPDSTNAQFANGHNADGTTFTALDKSGANTGAIGGDGQYDATNSSTTNYADRDQRAQITSIRVTVVGMNAQPEPGYTHPTETVAAIKNYKQYSLSSLIVPRNLGLSGSPEPSYIPPGQPSITGICTGHCNAPVVFWSAPTDGGPVYSYRVESDISASGPFNSYVVVPDPTATSVIMSDDGTDPSVVHYYRVTALNDNGAGPPSNVQTATPKNATKPMAPTSVTATNNQANQITLTWVGPNTNVSGKDSLSCPGGVTNPGGGTIPAQENVAFQVYRSTTSGFDPASSGVLVLDTTDASQPKGSPGATFTWVDTGAIPAGQIKPSSRVAPAACVTYYYRVRAVDRCAGSTAYNSSGVITDSQSDFAPVVGSPGQSGQATSTTTPSTPSGLAVDSANSACPAVVGGTTCKIVLTWNKVTTDTSGNAIGVDTYRITRNRKKLTCGGCSYTSDPTFTPLDVSGFTNSSSGIATYTDNSAPYKDNGDGQNWYYQYTVAAKNCSNYSAESNGAIYPITCSINPTVVSPNANNAASATGDTPADPWLFDVGDNITVTAPVGSPSPIASVKYDIKVYPAGTLWQTITSTTSPNFPLSWPVGAIDLQLYQIDMTVTNAAGCVEYRTKYVQDNKPANCQLQITNTPSVSNATSGSTTTASVQYTIQNTGSEDVVIYKASGPAFQGLVKTTWRDPTGATFSDMNFTQIDYTSTSDSFTDPSSGGIGATTSTIQRNIPASLTTIPAGSSKTITLRWQYKKTDGSLAAIPATKICLTYSLASEGYAAKNCNIVGQAASTANPGACD